MVELYYRVCLKIGGGTLVIYVNQILLMMQLRFAIGVNDVTRVLERMPIPDPNANSKKDDKTASMPCKSPVTLQVICFYFILGFVTQALIPSSSVLHQLVVKNNYKTSIEFLLDI